MTKAEDKDQKEVERASQNLEQLLALHRGTSGGQTGHSRNPSDRVVVPVDGRKKDLNMPMFWNLICEQYFQGVSKEHFQFLDEEFSIRHQYESSSPYLNLDSEEALRSFFLEKVNPEFFTTSNTPNSVSLEVAFQHFRLACQLYLPIMMMNPLIEDSFVEKFQDSWSAKTKAIARREEGAQGLKKEHQLLSKLLSDLGKPFPCQPDQVTSKFTAVEKRTSGVQNGKPNHGRGVNSKVNGSSKHDVAESFDSMIRELENELIMCQTQKEAGIKKLAKSLTNAYEDLEPDFRSYYCGNKQAMQSEEEVLGSVFAKRQYLFKEILRLEEIQIAESIMLVEELAVPGPSQTSRNYKIQFDETLLYIKMEVSETELLKMNRLREYSLFGVHRAGPNNPYQYYSFCKELNEICQKPGFEFAHKMTYNYDPQMLRDLKKSVAKPLKPSKAPAPTAEELAMCHHCKILLPRAKFFQCGKKWDFLRKRAMGSRIKTPPGCNKLYCMNCLNGWYGMDAETKVSCPACQKICFCTRCNRFENLEKFVQILERLDGDIDTLIINSPASKMAHRLLQLFPDLLNNTNQESDENSRKHAAKDSVTKNGAGPVKSESWSQALALHNQRYKQVHILKLLVKQVLERELKKQWQVVTDRKLFYLVTTDQAKDTEREIQQKMLGKRALLLRDDSLTLKQGHDYQDNNSTKSSSETGDKYQIDPTDLEYPQVHHTQLASVIGEPVFSPQKPKKVTFQVKATGSKKKVYSKQAISKPAGKPILKPPAVSPASLKRAPSKLARKPATAQSKHLRNTSRNSLSRSGTKTRSQSRGPAQRNAH